MRKLPEVTLMAKGGLELRSSSKAGFHSATSAFPRGLPMAVYQWNSLTNSMTVLGCLVSGSRSDKQQKEQSQVHAIQASIHRPQSASGQGGFLFL